MAKNRTSKSGTPAKRPRPETTPPFAPRRGPESTPRSVTPPPEEGGYLVPALLGVAVVMALGFYMWS
ncbi:MAG: hypothetical protein WCJ30_23930, partial [Deltaproteobacteria bacterium]